MRAARISSRGSLRRGAIFDYSKQSTLIGCLWQRENAPVGGVVDGVEYSSKWGAYFAVPYNTMVTANEANKVMLRTTANELIVEDGKVTGVKATQYDGTEVTCTRQGRHSGDRRLCGQHRNGSGDQHLLG